MSEITQEQTNEFIENYNLLFNVPNNKANKNVCEQYRKEHPNEFKGDGWSIVKHRKKLMDWFSKQSRETLRTLSE